MLANTTVGAPSSLRIPFRTGLVALLAATTGLTAVPSRAADVVSLSSLASHRASYRLTMAQVDPRAGIRSIEGGLHVEMQRSCTGTIETQQLLWTRTVYTDGRVREERTAVGLDEDPRTQAMNFETRRTLDARTQDVPGRPQLNFGTRLPDEARVDMFSGRAQPATGRNARGTQIAFTSPDGWTMPVPAGTMFPAEYTRTLVNMGATNEAQRSMHLFDGASTNGLYRVVAKLVGVVPTDQALPEAGRADLGGHNSWRYEVAHFAPGTAEAKPEYTANYRMFDNGVIGDMALDYGTYRLDGDLRSLELLAAPNCGRGPTVLATATQPRGTILPAGRTGEPATPQLTAGTDSGGNIFARTAAAFFRGVEGAGPAEDEPDEEAVAEYEDFPADDPRCRRTQPHPNCPADAIEVAAAPARAAALRPQPPQPTPGPGPGNPTPNPTQGTAATAPAATAPTGGARITVQRGTALQGVAPSTSTPATITATATTPTNATALVTATTTATTTTAVTTATTAATSGTAARAATAAAAAAALAPAPAPQPTAVEPRTATRTVAPALARTAPSTRAVRAPDSSGGGSLPGTVRIEPRPAAEPKAEPKVEPKIEAAREPNDTGRARDREDLARTETKPVEHAKEAAKADAKPEPIAEGRGRDNDRGDVARRAEERIQEIATRVGDARAERDAKDAEKAAKEADKLAAEKAKDAEKRADKRGRKGGSDS